jgi:HK97 gp10 family phage protein
VAVTIKGLGSLQAKLKKLDPMTRDAIEKGVALAGQKVEKDTKNITPVSTQLTRPGGPHGDLRKSVKAGQVRRTSNGAEVSVGTNSEYAMYVEFGTTKMAAQPYLRPSLQKNKSNAKRLIITEIVKAHRSL